MAATTMRAAMAPPTLPKAAKRAGASVAILLHVGVVAWLISYEPARTALLEAAPILVDFITPLAPPPPKVSPKQVARPVVPSPLPPPPVQQPILSIPQEVPAPTAPIVPPPPIVIAPPAPPVPVPQIIAAAPPAPPVPVTPPIFNAAYLDNPAPAYPAASKRFGEQGRVMLRVLVSAAGKADEIQIQTSSRHTRLDDAAREAVKRWRFVPAKRGAEAVAWWVLIPISFNVED